MNDKLKVLVVEDELEIRNLLKELLELKGHQVVLAENGQEVIFKSDDFQNSDLVITDLDMPNKDGRELILDIRSFDEDVPIIVMSGKSQVHGQLLKKYGLVQDFIAKPFSLEKIYNLILQISLKK